MADSTESSEIIALVQDRIETKQTGKVSSSDAAILLLIQIRDLLEQIRDNTAT